MGVVISKCQCQILAPLLRGYIFQKEHPYPAPVQELIPAFWLSINIYCADGGITVALSGHDIPYLYPGHIPLAQQELHRFPNGKLVLYQIKLSSGKLCILMS